jgi:hypothetical protein
MLDLSMITISVLGPWTMLPLPTWCQTALHKFAVTSSVVVCFLFCYSSTALYCFTMDWLVSCFGCVINFFCCRANERVQLQSVYSNSLGQSLVFCPSIFVGHCWHYWNFKDRFIVNCYLKRLSSPRCSSVTEVAPIQSSCVRAVVVYLCIVLHFYCCWRWLKQYWSDWTLLYGVNVTYTGVRSTLLTVGLCVCTHSVQLFVVAAYLCTFLWTSPLLLLLLLVAVTTVSKQLNFVYLVDGVRSTVCAC